MIFFFEEAMVLTSTLTSWREDHMPHVWHIEKVCGDIWQMVVLMLARRGYLIWDDSHSYWGVRCWCRLVHLRPELTSKLFENLEAEHVKLWKCRILLIYCWWLNSSTAWHVAYGRVVAFLPVTPLISRLCLHEGWFKNFSYSEMPMFHVLDHHNLKIEGVQGNNSLSKVVQDFCHQPYDICINTECTSIISTIRRICNRSLLRFFRETQGMIMKLFGSIWRQCPTVSYSSSSGVTPQKNKHGP